MFVDLIFSSTLNHVGHRITTLAFSLPHASPPQVRQAFSRVEIPEEVLIAMDSESQELGSVGTDAASRRGSQAGAITDRPSWNPGIDAAAEVTTWELLSSPASKSWQGRLGRR